MISILLIGLIDVPNPLLAVLASTFNYNSFSSYRSFVQNLTVTNRAIHSGKWSDPEVWENSILPSHNAVIEIPESVELTYDLEQSPIYKSLSVNGKLIIEPKKSADLNLSYLLVNGSLRVINTTNREINFNFNLHSTSNLYDSFMVLSPDGSLQMEGFQKELKAFLGIAHYPNDEILHLDRVMKTWDKGDEVLIVNSENKLNSKDEKLRLLSNASDKSYYFKNITNPNQVNFFRKRHKNPERSRLKIPVLNISRNININRVNSSRTGSFAIFSAFGGDLVLDSVALNDFGSGSFPALYLSGVDGSSAIIKSSIISGTASKGFINKDYEISFDSNVIYDTAGNGFEDLSELQNSMIINNFLLNIDGDAYNFYSPQAFKNFDNNFAANILGSALNFNIKDNNKFIRLSDTNYSLRDFPLVDLLNTTKSNAYGKKYKLSQLPIPAIKNFSVYRAKGGISLNYLSQDDDSFDRNLRAHSLENSFEKINLVKILDTAIDIKHSSRVSFNDVELIGTPQAKLADKGLKQDQNSRFISIKDSKIHGFKVATILGQTASSKLSDEINFGGTTLDNVDLSLNDKVFEAVEGSDVESFSLKEFVNQGFNLKAPLSPYNKINKFRSAKKVNTDSNLEISFSAEAKGGLTYLLDASDSLDKRYLLNWKNLVNSVFSAGNNTIASFAWDTDDDGVDDAWGRYLIKHFESEGIYPVKLTVVDTQGRVKSTHKDLEIKYVKYDNVLKNASFDNNNLNLKEFVQWSDYQSDWVVLGDGLSSINEDGKFLFKGKGKTSLAQVIYDKSRTKGLQQLSFDYTTREDFSSKLKVYGINGKFRYYQNLNDLIRLNLSEELNYDLIYESDHLVDELATNNEKVIEIDFSAGYEYILIVLDLESVADTPSTLEAISLNNSFLSDFIFSLDNVSLSSSRDISPDDFEVRKKAPIEAKIDILDLIKIAPDGGLYIEEPDEIENEQFKAVLDLFYVTKNTFQMFNPLFNDIYDIAEGISISFAESDYASISLESEDKQIYKFTPETNFTGILEIPYTISSGLNSSTSVLVFNVLEPTPVVLDPAPLPPALPAPVPLPPSGVTEEDLVLVGLFKDPGFQDELGTDFNYSNQGVFDSRLQVDQSWQVPSANSNWQKNEVDEYAFASNTGETALIQAVTDNYTHTGSLDLSFDVKNQGANNILRVQIYGINGHFKLSHTLVNQDPLMADPNNPITFNKLFDTGNVINGDFDWTHFNFKDISLYSGYQYLAIRIITDNVDVAAGDFLNLDTIFLRANHGVLSSYPERLFRRPSANVDSIGVLENGSVTFNVLVNDSDPDSDQITITANTIPVHGVLIPRGSGDFEYLPVPNYIGNDSFTYTISDGIFVASTNVNINVTNDPNTLPPVPPPPAPINILLDGDFSATVPAQFNINSGTTTSNNTNTGWWRPTGNEWNRDLVNQVAWVDAPATEALTQIVTDNFNNTGMKDFAIDVRANGNNEFRIQVWGMTGDFFYFDNNFVDQVPYDPNNGPLTVKLLASSSDLTTSGTMPWTRFEFKNIDFGTGYKFIGVRLITSGVDYASGEYLEVDNVFLGSNPVSSSLPLVREISPNAVYDLVDVTKNSIRTFNVLTNDTDPENDYLFVHSITNPSHGIIVDRGSGFYDYIPNTGYLGPDSFTYLVSDGVLVDEATVNLNVIDGVAGNDGSSIPLNLIINSDFDTIYTAGGANHHSINTPDHAWIRPGGSTFNYDAVNKWLYLDNSGARKLTYRMDDNYLTKNTVTFSYDYKVNNGGYLAFKVLGTNVDFEHNNWGNYSDPLYAIGTLNPIPFNEILATGDIASGTVDWTHAEHVLDLGSNGYKYIFIFVQGEANNGTGQEIFVDNIKLIRP